LCPPIQAEAWLRAAAAAAADGVARRHRLIVSLADGSTAHLQILASAKMR